MCLLIVQQAVQMNKSEKKVKVFCEHWEMMAVLNTVISILAFLPHLDGCLGFQITNRTFFPWFYLPNVDTIKIY